MFRRIPFLPARPEDSFFLWGPRQTGKTSLLKRLYADAFWLDLLQTNVQVKYSLEPHRLREEVLARESCELVVIDEVQKAPRLLDEVHWLIENTDTKFVLCGSSARKVRRGHANLLGGRALRFELFGLVSTELGQAFDLARVLNQGCLPRHYLSDQYAPRIRAYVNDYLKEEIAAEGLVRSLPLFSDFLASAALSDAELVNYSNIGRECGVSKTAVRGYFEILVDTMLGRFLPAYRRRPKRRVIRSPKFYFADVGVVNCLAKRGRVEPGSEAFGKALENWVFHELSAHCAYSDLDRELSYWRLAGGTEVDFIVGDMVAAIEVKGSARIATHHLKGLREIAVDHPGLERRILVCLETTPRRTEDGIDILPVTEFARRLWQVGDDWSDF